MSGEQIKRRERESYDAVAELFDTHWAAGNARVARQTLDRIGLTQGAHVLDVAGGTGAAGLVAATLVGEGEVVISDISPGALEIAARHASARGLKNVSTRVLDAEQLDLPAASIDRVVCVFGIMYIPDVARTVQQILRVLKPGGRVGFAVWGPPDRVPFFLHPMTALLRHAAPAPARVLLRLPIVGAALRRRIMSSRSPAGFSPARFGADGSLERELVAAGFVDVKRDRSQHRLEYPSFDSFWQALAEGTPAKLSLARLSAPVVAAVRSDLRRALPMMDDGRVVLDNEVAFITGRRAERKGVES